MAVMVVAALSVTSPCRAAPPAVAIWIGGPSDAQHVELATRLRAELAISGFSCVELDAATPGDVASLEQAARSAGAFAAIGVVRTGSLDADVWVTDRVTGKAVLRRVRFTADSSDAPAIFALRAVELLHASLLELEELHPPRGEVPPPPEIRRWVAPAQPAPEPTRYAAHVGAAVAFGPGGIPVRVAPALGVAWRPLATWGGGLEGWGPGLTTVEASGGNARVDQEAVTATAEWRPLGLTAVSPFVHLGIGATHLGVEGHAQPPLTSHSGQVWSALGVAGLGVTARTGPLELGTGIDALGSTPTAAIVFDGKRVARTTSPTLLFSLRIGLAW